MVSMVLAGRLLGRSSGRRRIRCRRSGTGNADLRWRQSLGAEGQIEIGQRPRHLGDERGDRGRIRRRADRRLAVTADQRRLGEVDVVLRPGADLARIGRHHIVPDAADDGDRATGDREGVLRRVARQGGIDLAEIESALVAGAAAGGEHQGRAECQRRAQTTESK